jgi:hypothetical protein
MGQVVVDVTGTVDRETLYREVWAHPMTTVAARYGVSSSFLARVCTRLNVPRPPHGYWAQLQVGRAPKKPNLPTPRTGDLLDWSRGGTLPCVAQGLAGAAPATTTSSRPRRSSRSMQHETLVGGREHFQTAKELDGGYLRPSKRRIADVFVSKDSLDHALGLAHSLFLALENADHRVTFAVLGSRGAPRSTSASMAEATAVVTAAGPRMGRPSRTSALWSSVSQSANSVRK